MKRTLPRMILCSVLIVLLCACSNQSDRLTRIQNIKSRGILRIGAKIDVPRFGYLDPETNQVEGLEADIARVLAKSILGDEDAVKFVPVTALTREPFLKNDEIDMVIATFTITADRKAVFNFSDPYFTDEIGFLVRTQSAIKRPDDLLGKKVGVSRLSTAYIAFSTASLMPDIDFELIDYASYPIVKNALLSGEIDAFAGDQSILQGYLDDHTVMLGQGINPQPYGIATQLDDAPFSRYINDRLSDMKNDGTLEHILNTWLGAQSQSGFLYNPI